MSRTHCRALRDRQAKSEEGSEHPRGDDHAFQVRMIEVAESPGDAVRDEARRDDPERTCSDPLQNESPHTPTTRVELLVSCRTTNVSKDKRPKRKGRTASRRA